MFRFQTQTARDAGGAGIRSGPKAKSIEGQSRRFDRPPMTSGLPPTPDILGARWHISKVPIRKSVGDCIKPSILPLAFGLVLPVVPLHIVDFEITGDGYADGREEVALS
jgi:hypothetical protein